jgi:two-component system OmpR family response regulator
MERTPHVLVVDDDREIRDLLARFLVRHGLRVSTAADGRAMHAQLRDGAVDLVVLDLMLPGDDGLALCRELRARPGSIPVIMLTAMGEEADRIVGLEMGADDYVAKPFNPRELLARIRAVLRRASDVASRGASADGASIHRFAGFEFDLTRRELRASDGALVPLTGGEFALLSVLVVRPGRVLSRDQLLDLARGRDAQPFDRSIDVQVSRLRRKIEQDPSSPVLIKTVRGGGYVFAGGPEPGSSADVE